MCYYAKGEISLTSYGVPFHYPHFIPSTSLSHATFKARHHIAFCTRSCFAPLFKGWLLLSLPVYSIVLRTAIALKGEWISLSPYGCDGLDSNQRPSAYEADELPTALPRNIWFLLINSKIYTKFFMYILLPIGSNLEPIDGLEPPTY